MSEKLFCSKLVILREYFPELIFFNEFGSAATPWRKKPPYKDGWAAVLPEGQVNYFFWNTLDHLTNITYRLGAFQMSADGDHLLLGRSYDHGGL